MKVSIKEARAKFRRRVIIDLLADDPGGTLNVWILSSVLAEFGEDARAGEVVALADWLAEAELVEIVHRGPPMVLRIADRGERLAQGRIRVDGVADRPTD